MKKEAIFILNSPFQGICALEAILHFNVKNPCFVVLNDIQSREMITPLIQGKGEIIYLDFVSEGVVELIKEVRKMNILSSRVFLGDYFSFSQYVMACIFASYKSTLYYLDDGNSSLKIFPPLSQSRAESRKEKYGYKVFGLLLKSKRIRTFFYSIYDFPKEYGNVIKNDFSCLRMTLPEKSEGIYLIGTNPDALKQVRDYRIILKESVDFLKKKYPSGSFFYCPHRRDSNDYQSYLFDLGVNIFETKISVEIDFKKNNIYPKCVAGFGSTALLTLKMMFPKTDSISFKVQSVNEKLEQTYDYIEEYFRRGDIEVVRL